MWLGSLVVFLWCAKEDRHYADTGEDSLASATVNDGQWHFVAYTLDDSTNTLRVYVADEAVLSVTTGTRIQSGDVLSIGQEFDGDGPSGHFQGLIDEVRVYNRALPEDELATLYDATK